MSNNKIYNIKKVHRVNLVILTLVELTLSFLALIGTNKQKGFFCFAAAAVFTIISAAVYFSRINDEIKAIFFTSIPLIVAIALIVTDSMTVMCSHYMFFLSIAMIALYFNNKLLIIYHIIINLVYSLLYGIRGLSFIESTPEYVNIWSLIQIFICINFILIILNFLTKWGNNLVNSAIEKERFSTELAEKLNHSMIEMQQNSEVLNTNIISFNKNISSSQEAVTNVNSAISDISDSITNQSEDLRSINEKMNTSSDNIKKSQDISDKVSVQSAEMNAKVEDGYAKVNDMDMQMEIIYQSVNTSYTTVNELQSSIEEINTFLEVITGISAQTNMLALNAAIEAARAGEHGKGFAVVADEVRSLAENSSNTVQDINKIISTIKEKTSLAVEKSQLGEEAVKSGKDIISKVKSTFDIIKQNASTNSEYLAQNAEMNSKTTAEFIKIAEAINRLTDISQNQAATIEEISATMETTTEDITSISNSVNKIKELSDNLKAMSE